MSKPKKDLEKARQIKALGNSGLKKIFSSQESEVISGAYYYMSIIFQCTEVIIYVR